MYIQVVLTEPVMHPLISSVVEFQRWWFLKSKIFGQESTYSNVPNKRACTFTSGKVWLLGSIKARRQSRVPVTTTTKKCSTGQRFIFSEVLLMKSIL